MGDPEPTYEAILGRHLKLHPEAPFLLKLLRDMDAGLLDRRIEAISRVLLGEPDIDVNAFM